MIGPGLLDRYVGKRFLGLYGICLLFFVLLFLIVDGVARIDDFIDASKTLPEEVSVWRLALEFYVNRMPVVSVLFAPYLTLFASIACLMTFTRHNELAAMVSSGRSLHRILLPVYVAAVVITGLLMIAEENVVPASLRRLESVERRLEGASADRGERVPHLRDGTNTFLAARWVVDELLLTDVRCLDYEDPAGVLPTGRLTAAELRYRKRPSDGLVGWFPVRGELVPDGTDAEGRLREPVVLPPDEPVGLGLSPTKIQVLVEEDVAALPSAQIVELRELYPDKFASLSMQLYSRRTRPIASFVLLLLGLPFVARPGQRSIAAGLAVAFGCCLVYMTFDLFCAELGAREGGLHPLVASWLTPVLFFAVGIARLDKIVT